MKQLLHWATNQSDFVQNALEKVKLDKATIVIAHRISTINNAHTIVVLNNGKVTESRTLSQAPAAAIVWGTATLKSLSCTIAASYLYRCDNILLNNIFSKG
ncbi:hypothetical protein IEQ34_001907 [Dendrobium chrysotoxum]|uniref:Uncharacterized protein n=1 Tax=Dendrobium chrysotoxum TaxID=161865 RepID=A0AAV7H3I3_DENCH|nr:hypothetical protein IEQ34_001907 [Dendrobium chrysotoxum]